MKLTLNPFHYARKLALKTVAKADVVFAAERNPLLRGDVLAYAEQSFPRDRFPTMWKRIPADLRRSVLWDGRLLNGAYPAELAKKWMTDEVVAEIAVKSAIRAMKFTVILTVLFALIGILPKAGFGGVGPSYPQWAADAGVWLPIIGYYIAATIEQFGGMIVGLLTAATPPLLLFPILWLSGFSAGMRGVWEQASEPYRDPTRDTALFWKSNAATREMQYLAYCREVEQATTRLADQPVIPVGKASGMIRARGDNEAPSRGQIVGFDGESIRQHLLVLGGTGSGKTRLIMRPLFRRLMNAAWGEGHKIGAYVTDGKGTLWRDLQKAVAHREDVRILGTDAGQFGIDLVQGMSPLEVSTTFKAVSGQVAGKPSDDFWPESASLLLMHAATIARSIKFHQPTVDEWARKWRIAPYSLLGIARIASQEDTTKYACRRIREIALEVAEDLTEQEGDDMLEALASADWLENTFLELAANTRSSIVANVNVVLGKLMGAREIAHRFCSGIYENQCDVDHALKGGILFVNVGETEHGMAGKVVATWLKTRLYIMAKRRLITAPEECKQNSCALFCDEAQMLVTTGPDSDSTFHNISRETGVFAIFATQSLAALKQVLGEDACANLVNLLRSKIILKTEELSTLHFARELVGECVRGWEYDDGLYATQAARELHYGKMTAPEIRFNFSGGPIFTAPTHQRASYDASFWWSYISRARPKAPSGQMGADDRGMYMSLAQREEDRNRANMVEGLQTRPKLDLDELLLGSGLAFAVIQRAGGDRSDIIDLEAEELQAA
jgi:hypothetical protein